MDNSEHHLKVIEAMNKLKANVQLTVSGRIETEEQFNNIEWITGKDSNDTSIVTKTNPHSEITWTKFKEEYDKL